MKKLVLAIIGVSVVASSAFAATTITANNLGAVNTESFRIRDFSSVLIPADTGTVALGTFTGDVNVSGTSIAAVLGNFVQFGESSVFGGVGTLSGMYDRAITGDVTADLVGQNVYTVLGNGSTLESSTDLLIFRGSALFIAEPGTTENARTNPDFGELVLGSTGTDDSLTPFSNYYNMAHVIPEPSTVLLTSLGAGFLLFRRRR